MTDQTAPNSPTVSVLLPVYNGARTVEAAIRSVLAQTFGDFELLVIDDGSTDGSAAIATALADDRIHVIGDSGRMGLAARLNQGIDAARGRFIARMDGDDFCFPERFANQVAFLRANPDVDLVGGRAVAFRDGGGAIGMLPGPASHAEIAARPWRGLPLAHPTWMGRAEWFRRHRYRIPEVLRAEDQELLLRALPDSRYACLDQPVLAYRQGGFSLRRNWLARRALLPAQVGLFLGRGQYANASLAVAVTMLKVLVDGMAALPGCDGLFFGRMGGPLPPGIARQLDQWGIRVCGKEA